MSCSGAGGYGMSDVYMLKSVGESFKLQSVFFAAMNHLNQYSPFN